ncbi:molecular chaperone [Adlercreutzia sp. ZJ138]|uniref:TorD/DmsD family molecular chaperone n=1 Tax=Adlercreutzia sp. ZJ138 TaxID=2709405 RepID=UPI0013ED26AE|nr:molecular chaperone TorD family protein [Adlercreutzia sp. ZJ138]
MPVTNLSNMFSLLSVAFAAPTVERARLVAEGTLASDVAHTWRALDLPEEPLSAFLDELEEYRGRDEQDVLHEIRQEYTRLFLIDHLVENTEGAWRKKAQGQETVFYMINDISTGVQDFMRFCGVVRPKGYNDSVDLIDNEWQFCSMLATDPAYLAEKGMSAEEKLAQFIDEHVRVWVPGFSDDVARETRCAYYRAFAALQKKLVEAL